MSDRWTLAKVNFIDQPLHRQVQVELELRHQGKDMVVYGALAYMQEASEIKADMVLLAIQEMAEVFKKSLPKDARLDIMSPSLRVPPIVVGDGGPDDDT